MSWVKKHPAWLYTEWQELLSNGNYRESLTLFDLTFISCGEIVVRANRVEHYPVLIVYPEGTPYQPPSIYLLKEMLAEDIIKGLAKLPQAGIEQRIRPFIRFLHRRHQGPSGSLCFVEAEDLHQDQAEAFRIRDILKRVRDWLAGFQTGRLPADSAEVELFHHFPNQNNKVTFLIPDGFFNEELQKGRFYFSQITPAALDHISRVYLGVTFEGATQGNIIVPIKETDETLPLHGYYIPSQEDIIHRKPELVKRLEDGTVIEGYWWSIGRELQPFETVSDLAAYLGEGQAGFKTFLDETVSGKLSHDEDLWIGIRFPSRPALGRRFEWQFFRFYASDQRSGLIEAALKELIERLSQREIEAIRGEYLDEQSFFKRNQGVFSRQNLKEQSIALFGLGALGSELADCLAKAGVGQVHLVDHDVLKAQNTVRHLCGARMLYLPKVYAVAINLVENAHHFVNVSSAQTNVFQAAASNLFPGTNSVGVSTVANDNTEAFLNEIAVKDERTVFYARSLRGGKAARIFRVTPGKDACKACLALYYQEEESDFIRIEEDPDLPLITTECNNPIRPASAADLKLIASLTAKVVLEHLEKCQEEFNHWVWSTEALPGLPASKELPYILKRQFLPPHPGCPVCGKSVPVPILLSEKTEKTILEEVKKVKGIETGGILIGFQSVKGEIIILSASGPGPKAIMTSTRFERDVEYCQEKLREASLQHGIRGMYVGEWHFHPSGSNAPSDLDIRSLFEIALQTNYATDKPAMIIVGPDHQLAGTIHPAHSEYFPTQITVMNEDKVLSLAPYRGAE